MVRSLSTRVAGILRDAPFILFFLKVKRSYLFVIRKKSVLGESLRKSVYLAENNGLSFH